MKNTSYVRGFVKVAAGMLKKSQSVTGYVSPQYHDFAGQIGSALARPFMWTVDDSKKSNEESGDEYRMMDSDPSWYNILVGGFSEAGNGIGTSKARMPFGALFNGNNYKLFRHNQHALIRKEIKDALKAGKKVRVFGHSYGGSTIGTMAGEFPGTPFIALDPVSRFERPKRTSKNLTVFYPKGKHPTEKDRITERVNPVIGGRWGKSLGGDATYIPYRGGHVSGLPGAVSKYIYDVQMGHPVEPAKGVNIKVR